MSDEITTPPSIGATVANPYTNPELFKAFAFVIDGEVAIHQLYLISSIGSQSTIAALSSDPKVVEMPMDLFPILGNGMTYADGVFTPSPLLFLMPPE